MVKYPRLIAGIEVVLGPGEALQLRGIEPPLKLSSAKARELLPRLLPLLDGSRDLAALQAELPGEPVAHALAALASRGLLEEGGEGSEALAFFSHLLPINQRHPNREAVAAELKPVYLEGEGLLYQLAQQLLPASGVPLAPTPAAGALIVLAQAGLNPSRARELDRQAVATGKPWIGAWLKGRTAQVGPTVWPGDGPCYHCYEGRRLTTTDFPKEELAYRQYLETQEGPAIEWLPLAVQVAGFLTAEVIRTLTSLAPPATHGRVAFFDGAEGTLRLATLWRLPRCPVCGGVAP